MLSFFCLFTEFTTWGGTCRSVEHCVKTVGNLHFGFVFLDEYLRLL